MRKQDIWCLKNMHNLYGEYNGVQYNDIEWYNHGEW